MESALVLTLHIPCLICFFTTMRINNLLNTKKRDLPVAKMKSCVGCDHTALKGKLTLFEGIQKWNYPFRYASIEILAYYIKLLLLLYFDELLKQFIRNHSKIKIVQSGCNVQ